MNYRTHLPHLGSQRFLTDGGLETTLIFQDGLDLPEFAAFPLLDDESGSRSLRNYYLPYVGLAHTYQLGFILESPTWRANPDWATKLGYSKAALADVNRRSIAFMAEIRSASQTETSPMVISGCIGPRGDGYVPSARMTVNEAQHYHAPQIGIFSQSEADLVSAITMNYVEEAIGIVRAAQAVAMPVVISFTVETDGKLPTGQSLQEAIAEVDQATNSAAAYYMINCAHPRHFGHLVAANEAWAERVRGVRANASTKSHAELNESTALDTGDIVDFEQQHRNLLGYWTQLRVFGGCCGTDARHVEAICKSLMTPLPAA